jgi:hypothetical protein
MAAKSGSAAHSRQDSADDADSRFQTALQSYIQGNSVRFVLYVFVFKHVLYLWLLAACGCIQASNMVLYTAGSRSLLCGKE